MGKWNEKIFTREDADKLPGKHIVIPEGFIMIGDDSGKRLFDDRTPAVKSVTIPKTLVF